MGQPSAVAFNTFAEAWLRAIETEIGAALCVHLTKRANTGLCYALLARV